MAAQGGTIFCLHDRSEPELKICTKESFIDGPYEVEAWVSICFKCGRKWFVEA